MAEYEALLLGIELEKALKVKLLCIKGDSDLVIMQIKNKFICKNQRLRNYRNVVWDTMEYFDAINLEAIPREKKILADELVVAASIMQLSDKLIEDKTKMDIIFKTSIPDKFKHGKAFDNETHVIHFLNHFDKFHGFSGLEREESYHMHNLTWHI